MQKLRKDGTPDRRFKKEATLASEYNYKDGTVRDVLSDEVKLEEIETGDWEVKTVDQRPPDAQEVLNAFLELRNIQLDFDVIEGTVPTKFGIIKLDKPVLVVKASYVHSK